MADCNDFVFCYGDYDFSPRPNFTINSTPLKTPDGSGYGVIHNISLNGEIITTGTEETNSGVAGVFSKIQALKSALNQDGCLLHVSGCSGNILKGYPQIESFNFSPIQGDNYVRRSEYTIDLKMPTLILGTGNDPFNNATVFPPYIESCSENWDVNFGDERTSFTWTLSDGTVEQFGYKLSVTHTVDVKARLNYTGCNSPSIPWEDAKDYATGKLGFNSEFVNLTGILGLPGEDFSRTDVYNNYRQVAINKTEGSIQVTETFIVTPSGSNSLPNDAVETFNISVNQSEGVATVNIAGEIQGLEVLQYNDFSGVSSKFAAASGYYNLVKGRFFDRANTSFLSVTGDCLKGSLNTSVKSKVVGINPIQGTITYDFTYDTTPTGCITGECILSQNITIDDQLATDIFASHTVLGRVAGPILQDINTITARVRTVNIEIVTLPPTACSTVEEIYKPVPTGEIQDFVDVISGDLLNNYSQVFVSNNSESWNFSIGRFSKSIGYTYVGC